MFDSHDHVLSQVVGHKWRNPVLVPSEVHSGSNAAGPEAPMQFEPPKFTFTAEAPDSHRKPNGIWHSEPSPWRETSNARKGSPTGHEASMLAIVACAWNGTMGMPAQVPRLDIWGHP
jgi:hypothetical protein